MAVGFAVMLVSPCFHFVALGRVNKPRGDYFLLLGCSDLYLGIIISLLLAAIRACSFLSNSYICYCLMRLENLHYEFKSGTVGFFPFHVIPITQWSLLATCLFFCIGHWCAFEGLRYSAAFIGFDEFVLRQAALLTIDTFGFTHILTIFGLPFLVCTNLFGPSEQRKQVIFLQLSRVYLMYGMIMTTTTTFTMICVSIQRRHLMVCGFVCSEICSCWLCI